MAELTPSERLQPCLIDRLTDEHPDQQRESRQERIISFRRYLDGVRRDLMWLLNTGRSGMGQMLEEFPEVASSVLNYGVRDLTGMVAEGLDVTTIERELVRALRRFEPRIDPNSLKVRAVERDGSGEGGQLCFEISGELWAQPVPEELYIQTEVDLGTGRFEVHA